MAWYDQATSHYLNQWWLVYWRIRASLGLNVLRYPTNKIQHVCYRMPNIFIFASLKTGALEFWSWVGKKFAKDKIFFPIMSSIYTGNTWRFSALSYKQTRFKIFNSYQGALKSSISGQNDRHFLDDVFRCIFVIEKFSILIKISLNFVPIVPFWPVIILPQGYELIRNRCMRGLEFIPGQYMRAFNIIVHAGVVNIF